MNPDPVTLDHSRALDASLVGNKAAELARLRAAGFDVPGGVVLPVGIEEAWVSNPVPDPAPDWVRQAAQEACATLGERLAVRSSSTWEDADTSAHAGATATVLDVRGVDAVLDAVRQCLDASAEQQRVRGIDGSIAVLVQQLVPAEHAGVAFTADPITGERDIVRIAATAGLGEALVQGEVVGSDVTVRGDRVEGDLAGLPVENALAVAKMARDIEALYGQPQDIEWAVVDGNVHVLQARPITVLPVEPSPPEGNNWQKDVAHYPEPMTPFGWSLLHESAEVTRSVFDENGLLVRGLEEVLVGGEVYDRVVPAIGSANSAGRPPPAAILGLAARVVPKLRRRNATARHVLETGQIQRWVDEWHSTDRPAMQRRATELAEIDLTTLSDAALAEHLVACLQFTRDGTQIHFRLVMPLAHALFRLHTLVGDELDWDDAKIASMLAGHSPATRAAEDAMSALRDRVHHADGAVAALEADPGHPVEVLSRLDGDLGHELQAWIDEHGWALVNYDAGVPVLAERPTIITRLILKDPEAGETDDAEAVAASAREALPSTSRSAFDDALREARAIYPVREDNTIIVGDRPLALLRLWMLEVADRLVARAVIARDDAAYLFVDELRAALVGEETDGLTDRIVRRRGEEAWVRAQPGPLYVGKQAPPPDISRLPDPLRRVNEPVMWVISHEYPAPVEAPSDEEVLLAGVASSPGVAEGTVRVIRGHHDMDRLSDGDVLVCRVTSPAWAPLFPLAAAVVADGGGVLSHAAIAAREHGLPAVLGTAEGTSTLRDGQRVRVDGTRGLVFALD